MSDLPVSYFEGYDGAKLAYRELGEGRPLLLIHGYFSTALVNWVRYGHADRIAERGHRVIMPDLRGHGESAKPHEASAYRADALTDDGFALVDQLRLTDYDLGGYSLGSRTAIRMLARGATPGRAVLAGMGLSGVTDTEHRTAFFRRVLTNLGSFDRGSAEWSAEAFLKTTKGDPVALLRVLETVVDTSTEQLAEITVPTLVVSGADDHDNGSAEQLAAVLPDARQVAVPGNHMSAVAQPGLGTAIADFLD